MAVSDERGRMEDKSICHVGLQIEAEALGTLLSLRLGFNSNIDVYKAANTARRHY